LLTIAPMMFGAGLALAIAVGWINRDQDYLVPEGELGYGLIRSGSDASSAPLSAPRKRRRCGNLDRWPSGGGQACCECTDHINCRGAKSRQRRDRAGAFDHEQLRDAGSGGACCYSDGADKSECVSPPAGCH
jgi:hypothetical protein